MSIQGLRFVFAALDEIEEGICPACHEPLPARTTRSRDMTCDEVCHEIWIDRIVHKVGLTKRITSTVTGKTYLVPTRVILERGITHDSLVTYPEAP